MGSTYHVSTFSKYITSYVFVLAFQCWLSLVQQFRYTRHSQHNGNNLQYLHWRCLAASEWVAAVFVTLLTIICRPLRVFQRPVSQHVAILPQLLTLRADQNCYEKDGTDCFSIYGFEYKPGIYFPFPLMHLNIDTAYRFRQRCM